MMGSPISSMCCTCLSTDCGGISSGIAMVVSTSIAGSNSGRNFLMEATRLSLVWGSKISETKIHNK